MVALNNKSGTSPAAKRVDFTVSQSARICSHSISTPAFSSISDTHFISVISLVRAWDIISAFSFTTSPVDAVSSPPPPSPAGAAVSELPVLPVVLFVLELFPQPASSPASIAAERTSANTFFFILFPPFFILKLHDYRVISSFIKLYIL